MSETPESQGFVFKGGMLPAIVQDEKTGELLMVAYMNEEALSLTLSTGKAHYYSRSRDKLWLKGESSGHIQKVKSVYRDCDQDTILLKIEQEGAACHAGYKSCFFEKRKEDGTFEVTQEKVFDPDQVYK